MYCVRNVGNPSIVTFRYPVVSTIAKARWRQLNGTVFLPTLIINLYNNHSNCTDFIITMRYITYITEILIKISPLMLVCVLKHC